MPRLRWPDSTNPVSEEPGTVHLWVRSFETIEELRLALLEFQRTYNEQWMLAKYDYRSPAQVRRDFDGLDAVA